VSPKVALSFVVLLALVVSLLGPLEKESSQYFGDDVLWLSTPYVGSLDQSADTDILYARLPINVRGRTQFASLSIQASDEYVIWINGEQVAADFVAGRRINARFDIKSLLRNGENYLAFKIVGHRRGESPKFRAEVVFADDLGRKRFVTNQDWLVTPVIRTTGPGSTSDSSVRWTHVENDPSPWQVPSIVYSSVDELEADSNMPLYMDFTRLTGGWFWPLSNGDSTTTISTNVSVALGAEFSLGVSVEGSYEISVNRQVAAVRQSTIGTMVVNDLTAFMRPGDNIITLSLVSSSDIPKVALAGFSSMNNYDYHWLSLPEAWGVGHSAIRYESFEDAHPDSVVRYEDFSSRLPQVAQVPMISNWPELKAEFRDWLIRLLTVAFGALAVVFCYRVVYGNHLLPALVALGSVASALTIVWIVLLFLPSILAVNFNHLYYGAPWLTLVALFFAVLIKPDSDVPEAELK
jgi:hypothetical protein